MRAPTQLPRYLTLAYGLLIAYACLHPFTDWQPTGLPWFDYLAAPWPKYYRVNDIVLNVLGYLPLGFVLAAAWPVHWPRVRVVALTVLAAAVLSLSLETLQTLLPTRVASNVDLGANVAGALLGALGEADRRLGRRREHDDLIGSEIGGGAPSAIGEELLGEDAGEEQPTHQRVAVLTVVGAVVHGIRFGVDVGAIHGSVGLTVVTVVAESIGGCGRGDHDAGRHREPAVEAAPDGDVVVVRLGHFSPAHGRHATPRQLGREELPVGQHVAEHRIRDVVGGDGESVDAQSDLTVSQALGSTVDQARRADLLALDLENGGCRVSRHPHSMTGRTRNASAPTTSSTAPRPTTTVP